MRIGAYVVPFNNRPLAQNLEFMRSLGFDAAEVGSGGFDPSPLCPVRELTENADARAAWLAEFARAGVQLSALNCNGNPLHPAEDVGPVHTEDLEASIRLAEMIGVRNVITMSGLPGTPQGGTIPHWVVVAWDSEYLKLLDWQWNEIALPYWTRMARLAEDAGVRICIEAIPQTLVYNPAMLQRLIDEVGSTAIGANLDPSHLLWQGIDPILAARNLRGRVFHAHAKDTTIDSERVKQHGVLDERRALPTAGQETFPLGGRINPERSVVAIEQEDAAWRFAAAGSVHDAAWWGEFMAACEDSGCDAISVEHEDIALPAEEGWRVAAATLLEGRAATA